MTSADLRGDGVAHGRLKSASPRDPSQCLLTMIDATDLGLASPIFAVPSFSSNALPVLVSQRHSIALDNEITDRAFSGIVLAGSTAAGWKSA